MAETVAITTQDLEPAVRLRDLFEAEGFDVELLTAGEKLADVDTPVLLVLTGDLDDKRSRRLLRETSEYGGMAVVGLAETAAQAVPDECRRRGIAECFVKPADLDEVALVGRRLIERWRLRRETGIIGETEAMREVLERVVQIAPVHSTVLITGESGTGKELVARVLYSLSPRRHRAFIAANVAALSDTLLESELFGHEKGSFTGAVAQRKGLFELADRGTLFLDEIGEMPLATQTKLLRVLEEKKFYRVGGEEPITVDVRVLTATNQDLKTRVDLNEFRRDLYYRLNVLHIELPPLRERREDIPLLIRAFARRAAEEHDRPPVHFEPEAIELLLAYDWPGNVRELRNMIESIVVLAPDRGIKPEDLPEAVRSRTSTPRVNLPARIPRRAREDGSDSELAPQLEFIFRTLIELRMEVEDLKRDFEEYRSEQPRLTGVELPYPPLTRRIAGGSAIEDALVHGVGADEPEEDAEQEEIEDEAAVVFRPGMTMQEMERAAIIAALEAVDGNRRRAAEMLQIGERTLYRKIKEYEIPL